MIDQVIEWLKGARSGEREREPGSPDELQLALSALLVEAGYSDDHFDQSERRVVAELIERRFNLTPAQAKDLLAAGERAADHSTELFRFTRIINDRLSLEERIELIEMLWEVAYADGVLDKFEDSLLRRIGGLIYIPDRERGIARQRVMTRRGLDAPPGDAPPGDATPGGGPP